jgi:predicted acylesterase/phospholipase RssA
MPQAPQETERRSKLGLALSGGGFRASFFHLGVLRRLAELDILRHVEVLSTVSGGSILGALYMLRLKQRLDRDADLGRDEYVEIVKSLQRDFIGGVRKNLRTRLLLNPLANLRIICTPYTLARRMGRLYERYIYAGIVKEMWPAGKRRRPGRVPLRDVRIRPGGEPLAGGIETYNADPAHHCKVPQLVLNATCLNSGRSWRFTTVEIGDPVLGHIRYDEIELLHRYRKQLSEREIGELWPLLDEPPAGFRSETVAAAILWRLWRRASAGAGNGIAPGELRQALDRLAALAPPRWPALAVLCRSDFPMRRLMTCELGRLRAAKLEAWYVRRGPAIDLRLEAGLSRGERERRFWFALREIGGDIWDRCRREAEGDRAFLEALMDFVLDLYYLRLSRKVGPKAARDFDAITLGDAVAASACFPPVFPPYTILGLYDDTHVATLRLTDGGVFDNQGLSALFEEKCTHIIASDAGGTLEVQRRVTAGRLGMMGRIVSILMDNVRRRQLRRLREEERVAAGVATGTGAGTKWEDLKARYHVRKVAFFHMGTPPADGDREGLPPHPEAEAIARIRTDLDAFGDAEIAALTYQGYALADRFVRRYLKGSPFASPDWQPATQTPLPRLAPEARETRLLRVGMHRFFRALRFGAWDAWIVTLGLTGAAIAVTWRVRLTPRDFGAWVGDLLTRLWPLPADRPISLGLLVLLLAAVVAVVAAWPGLVRGLAGVRRLVTAVKWTRALAGNLSWPLGLLPVWLSLLAAAVAALSHWVFNRAFLRVSRYRAEG